MKSQNLLDGWILRGVINRILDGVISVNLFVAVWGGDTTPAERAIYVILADAVCMCWSVLGESDEIRSKIMKNYPALLWTMIIMDSLLLPLYAIKPYWYLVAFTILFDGAYYLMFSTMVNEVKEVLLTDPNERNRYNARIQKTVGAGSIIGGVLAIFLPLTEWGTLWMIGMMLACSVGCGCMTTHIFLKTKKYMAENNLVFHCCK